MDNRCCLTKAMPIYIASVHAAACLGGSLIKLCLSVCVDVLMMHCLGLSPCMFDHLACPCDATRCNTTCSCLPHTPQQVTATAWRVRCLWFPFYCTFAFSDQIVHPLHCNTTSSCLPQPALQLTAKSSASLSRPAIGCVTGRPHAHALVFSSSCAMVTEAAAVDSNVGTQLFRIVSPMQWQTG